MSKYECAEFLVAKKAEFAVITPQLPELVQRRWYNQKFSSKLLPRGRVAQLAEQLTLNQ